MLIALAILIGIAHGLTCKHLSIRYLVVSSVVAIIIVTAAGAITFKLEYTDVSLSRFFINAIIYYALYSVTFFIVGHFKATKRVKHQ